MKHSTKCLCEVIPGGALLNQRNSCCANVNRELAGVEPENFIFVLSGILKPETYCYRRLFTDAVRAVEAARNHPAVDALHVAIDGISQGGGVTLAVSGLVSDLDAILPGVPFLCHYRKATEISTREPYNEISR